MTRGMIRFFAICAMAMAALGCSGPVEAGGIATCNGCTFAQMNAAAKTRGLGYVYVVDYTTPKVRLYRYFEESPGYKLLEPVAVPPHIQQMLLDRKVWVTSGTTGVVIDVDEGDWPGEYFVGNPIEEFTGQDYGAFDVIANATLRQQVELSLTSLWQHSNPQIDTLTQALASVILSAVSAITGDQMTYIIRITWADGSTSKFLITSADTTEADYMEGESRDANGNVLPDAAAQSSDASSLYTGTHDFTTPEQAEDWYTLALMYGIPVTGPSTSQRMVCIWDYARGTLTCHYE